MTAIPQDHLEPQPTTFSFVVEGETFTIPALNVLPVGLLRKARKLSSDVDQSFFMVEAVMGEDSPEMEALDKMSPTEFNDFLMGWTQRAPLGESSDS